MRGFWGDRNILASTRWWEIDSHWKMSANLTVNERHLAWSDFSTLKFFLGDSMTGREHDSHDKQSASMTQNSSVEPLACSIVAASRAHRVSLALIWKAKDEMRKSSDDRENFSHFSSCIFVRISISAGKTKQQKQHEYPPANWVLARALVIWAPIRLCQRFR